MAAAGLGQRAGASEHVQLLRLTFPMFPLPYPRHACPRTNTHLSRVPSSARTMWGSFRMSATWRLCLMATSASRRRTCRVQAVEVHRHSLTAAPQGNRTSL